MRGPLVAVALFVALAACTTSEPESSKPTFGGGSAPTFAPGELGDAKRAAGIEDCPALESRGGESDLPDVALDCLGGGAPVNLADLAGKPTIINLWASWCVPCRTEMPLLARAHQEYGDAVRFIGIDYNDSAPDDAIELARASGVTYPLLADADQTTRADLKVVGLPHTIFLDAQGRITTTVRGDAFRSYADLTAAIERHLGVTP